MQKLSCDTADIYIVLRQRIIIIDVVIHEFTPDPGLSDNLVAGGPRRVFVRIPYRALDVSPARGIHEFVVADAGADHQPDDRSQCAAQRAHKKFAGVEQSC